MTDIQTTVEMFTRAGIEFSRKQVSYTEEDSDVKCYSVPLASKEIVTVGDKDDYGSGHWNGFAGYYGFYSTLFFDEHGKLLAIGAWE